MLEHQARGRFAHVGDAVDISPAVTNDKTSKAAVRPARASREQQAPDVATVAVSRIATLERLEEDVEAHGRGSSPLLAPPCHRHPGPARGWDGRYFVRPVS